MLQTAGDLKTEVLVRLEQGTTTSGLYTDAILNDHVRQAHKFAASYHKWPFTEGRVQTTFSATEEWNFEGYKADSFRLVQVGGKRLKKLDFRNYQIFREEEPNSDERVFSDLGRTLFINPKVDLTGTLTAWGQYEPAIDPTDLEAKTVFSDGDEEGNEAIVQLMLSYAKTREQKINESESFYRKALEILDRIWGRVLDEQHQYQTHPDSGGMFERFDVLRGDYEENILKRDQF